MRFNFSFQGKQTKMAELLKTITPTSKLKLILKKDKKMRNMSKKTNNKGCILKCASRNPPEMRATFQYYDNNKIKKTSKVFRLYQIIYFLKYDDIGEISHLCSNKNCLNIEHLIVEKHETNCSRIQCNSSKHCSGHGEDEPCVLH